MKRRAQSSILTVFTLSAGVLFCGPGRARAPASLLPVSAPDSMIRVTLLHLNDVYEIAPLQSGRYGGLARVATIRKRLVDVNPHTYTVLAGDFVSPSALGTAPLGDGRLDGKQMVAVLNALGLDFATFGNHEFDLKRESFYQRLAEARFTFVSSNTLDSLGNRFPGVLPHRIVTVTDQGGRVLRLGLVGATIPTIPPGYTRYSDPIEAVRSEARVLRDSVDILIALTHLSLAQDKALAEAVPELDLILGGHEHENWELRRGDGFTPILKADANARTVYVVEITFDPARRRRWINPRLMTVTDSIPDDSATAQEVQHWLDLAYRGFRQAGFEPAQVVADVPVALDGRESVIRQQPTTLTQLIADALLREADSGEVAIYNSGSIRLDDVLPAGRVTQYDVIRILPFGGKVLTVEMQGSLLSRVLDQGQTNRNSGGYLQMVGVDRGEAGAWRVHGRAIASHRWYRVATTEFLVSGRESGLSYLKPGNVGLRVVHEHRDIRLAVMDQLRQTYRSR